MSVRRVTAMIASVHNVCFTLAFALVGMTTVPSHVSAQQEERPSDVPLPPLVEPGGQPEVPPDAESKPGPKNIIHLLPPPVTDEAAPRRADATTVLVPPCRPRPTYVPESGNESEGSAQSAGRPTTPQDLVRERAAQRDLERRRRIEGRRWAGYEPLRPTVAALPFMSGTSW